MPSLPKPAKVGVFQPPEPRAISSATGREVPSESHRRNAEQELIQPFKTLVECAEGPQTSLELPARRCPACDSWLFWVSVYGVVVCSTCHPPATPDLIRNWYWLPEGECKKIQ